MAGERVEGLPDVMREWVESKADELDTTPQSVLARAVAAYRLMDDHGDELETLAGGDLPASTGENVTERLAALEDAHAEVGTVRSRVDQVESSFDEKIEDVRNRVVQVKRETDAKAPADHDHPELAARIDEEATTVDELRDDLRTLEGRVDEGFDNYEEVVEYLSEAVDDAEAKLDRLAGALVDLRRVTGDLETAASERAAAAELKTAANRQRTRTADCGECGSEVDVGLLSAPRCPHCDVTLVDVEPGRGFFGSARLVPGQRPALEGATEEPTDAEDLLEVNDD